MIILPIHQKINNNLNIYNNSNQRKTYNSKNLTPLSVDTVSFSGRAHVPNSEKLKQLLQYGIPDMYSDIILIDPNEIRALKDRGVFSKPLRIVVKELEKFKDSFFPVQKDVFTLLKKGVQTDPNITLEVYFNKLAPIYNKKLNKIQKPIFEDLNSIAGNLPPDLYEKYLLLIEDTTKKLANNKRVIPFNLSTLKKELTIIMEQIENSKNKEGLAEIKKILRLVKSLNFPKKFKIKNFRRKLNNKNNRKRKINKFKPRKKIIEKYYDLIFKINKITHSSQLKHNKNMLELIKKSAASIFKVSTNIKFDRKTFIDELKEITNQADDKKLEAKILKVATQLPTPQDSVAAFIVRAASRSSEQIGLDLLIPSQGTVDHLLAHKKGGADNINNYGLASSYENSKKAHSRFETLLKNNPAIASYCQHQIDYLIELANSGVFKKIGLSTDYIRNLVKTLQKISPHDTPLILDTNKLQY